VPVAFRLRGTLDEEALRRALDALVARHEVLRTRYEDAERGPVQVCDLPGQVKLETVNLGEVPPGDQAGRLDESWWPWSSGGRSIWRLASSSGRCWRGWGRRSRCC